MDSIIFAFAPVPVPMISAVYQHQHFPCILLHSSNRLYRRRGVLNSDPVSVSRRCPALPSAAAGLTNSMPPYIDMQKQVKEVRKAMRKVENTVSKMSSQMNDFASKKIIEIPKLVQELKTNVTDCELEMYVDNPKIIRCSKEEFKAEAIVDDTPISEVLETIVLKQSQTKIELISIVEESQVPKEFTIIEESIEDVTNPTARDTKTDKIHHVIVPMQLFEDIKIIDFVIPENLFVQPRDVIYTVGDFMTKKEDLHVVKTTTTVEEALETLVEKRITGFPVVDDDWKLVGVVSDYDLLALDSISGAGQADTNLFPDVDSSWKSFNEIQRLLGKTNGKVVGDLMTPVPLSVREATNLEDAVRLLLETKFRRLPVVDGDGKLVGIITRGNIVRAALQIKLASERISKDQN